MTRLPKLHHRARALLIAGATTLVLIAGSLRADAAYLYAVGSNSIDRYPLVDGVARTSDVSYALGFGDGDLCSNQFAIGPHESFIALTCGKYQSVSAITEYASGTHRVLRQIVPHVARGQILEPGAITADARGTIYFSYSFSPVSARTMNATGSPDVRDQGTSVFAPGASGHAKPLVSFGGFGYHATLDASGDLYLGSTGGGSENTIVVYATPGTKPHLTATIEAPADTVVTGLAVDAKGDLFASCATPSSAGESTGFILAYPPGANGPAPIGLTFVPPLFEPGQIGITGTTVYAATADPSRGVVAFDGSGETRLFPSIFSGGPKPQYIGVMFHE